VFLNSKTRFILAKGMDNIVNLLQDLVVLSAKGMPSKTNHLLPWPDSKVKIGTVSKRAMNHKK